MQIDGLTRILKYPRSPHPAPQEFAAICWVVNISWTSAQIWKFLITHPILGHIIAKSLLAPADQSHRVESLQTVITMCRVSVNSAAIREEILIDPHGGCRNIQNSKRQFFIFHKMSKHLTLDWSMILDLKHHVGLVEERICRSHLVQALGGTIIGNIASQALEICMFSCATGCLRGRLSLIWIAFFVCNTVEMIWNIYILISRQIKNFWMLTQFCWDTAKRYPSDHPCSPAGVSRTTTNAATKDRRWFSS